MRLVLLLLLSVSLGACSLLYRLPTRQGNVMDQKDLDKLQTGMSREQVLYVLGTPLAASPFRSDRWDYVGYYKSPRGVVTSRTVTLFFQDEKVSSITGAEAPAVTAVAKPNQKELRDQERKDVLEAERAKEDSSTGVILGTPTPNP